METVGQQKLWSFNQRGTKAVPISCTAIRHANARQVNSFRELAKLISELQFMNRDMVLLFRGQPDDYKNRAENTTIKPKILRAIDSRKLPTDTELQNRYEVLAIAEEELVNAYRSSNSAGSTRLRRQQILRWSILQHYEICETPLLDVTHSLRIAASFATKDADDIAYVFVLGVPNLSGAITASADAGLQIIRLASVCPPSAVRPHIQEGYLLGEYPEMVGMSQKQHYKHFEIDFGRRLVGKFSFAPKSFWNASPDFPLITKSALYPEDDPLLTLKDKVMKKIKELI